MKKVTLPISPKDVSVIFLNNIEYLGVLKEGRIDYAFQGTAKAYVLALLNGYSNEIYFSSNSVMSYQTNVPSIVTKMEARLTIYNDCRESCFNDLVTDAYLRRA